jgi:predicted ATPase
VIAHLQWALAWQRDEPPEAKLRKLEEVLALHAMPLPEVVPLFAALLSVPLAERYPPLNLTPQRQKQKTLEALLAWLLAEAARQPVLFIVEDLHWVDPSTVELLSLMVDQGPTARLCSLFTFRPDFTPPWMGHAHLTPLALGRLSRAQVEGMVQSITGGKALPPEVIQQIVIKTDGVPLFVEELTKAVLESGLLREEADRYELTGPLPTLAIPATLRDALMARLDQLGPAKAVAQVGATIGRQFAYELLRAVSALDDTTLQQELATLVEAELLYQRGLPPQAMYLFKHALIQDAAYQSLLRSTRQQYHEDIAQALAERFPETAETQPELLAHHYTEAGLGAQAIPYWQQAGRRVLERSAHVEAISHLTKGLEVLKTLPDTPERTQQELDLQTLLGSALMATKGYAAPEVEHTYARARELCQRVGETPRLFPVLWGLWAFYLVRAELQTARVLGEQLLRLAQSAQDPALLLEAHYALGDTLFWLGELIPARTHFEQSVALYDPQQHSSLASLYGEDAKVTSLSYLSWILWRLGYPHQALQKSQEALVLAQKLSHAHSLAFALFFATWLHQLLGEEGRLVQERAEAVITLSAEHGFVLWEAVGAILRGWALAEQGQGEEGMAQMRQGLAAFRATGTRTTHAGQLALVAEAYEKGGQMDKGLTLLAEALEAMHTTGDRSWEAELCWRKGELLLALSTENQTDAEACFQQALAVARRQQAKSWELRAAMSLGRLWQRQGKRNQARQVLAEVYGWFTEGFDTADLQEARALLEALG